MLYLLKLTRISLWDQNTIVPPTPHVKRLRFALRDCGQTKRLWQSAGSYTQHCVHLSAPSPHTAVLINFSCFHLLFAIMISPLISTTTSSHSWPSPAPSSLQSPREHGDSSTGLPALLPQPNPDLHQPHPQPQHEIFVYFVYLCIDKYTHLYIYQYINSKIGCLKLQPLLLAQEGWWCLPCPSPACQPVRVRCPLIRAWLNWS